MRYSSALVMAPEAVSVTFCSGPYERSDRRVGIGLGDDVADVVERNIARRRRHRIDLDPHGEFLRAIDQHLRDAGQLRNLLRERDLARTRRQRTAAASARFKLMYMTGKSPGLTLRKLGGVVISTGSLRAATVSAVCTSSAAPSILRLRSNWMVIEVMPSEDEEVSELMPAMVESWRSIGAATEAAMVSALAPGSCRGDADGGKVDGRQRRDRQQPVGEDAQDDDRRGDQRGQHRPANAGLREHHGLRSGLRRARGHLGSVGK